MSILNRFEAVYGRDRRPALWRKPAIVALNVENCGFDEVLVQDRYILRAQLGVEFWANSAQYEDALKIARRIMLARIYENTLPLIQELRHAIFNQDAESALAIVDAMEKEITE